MKTGRITYLDGLFTAALLPDAQGTFPIIIRRSPYVDAFENLTDDEACEQLMKSYSGCLDRGWAVVVQDCRGTGKSAGDFCAYVNERADGLALQAWCREQDFYQGELYLDGGSYLSSVHYATAPFAPDIKAAVLAVQDTERYNVCYRNGFFKIGLHGNWFVGNYHKKSIRNKNLYPDRWETLPLISMPERVFGEECPVLIDTLRHPDPSDAYWQTLPGGSDARDAVKDAGIPILLRTGFYDIYTGGVFDMWHAMTERTRAMSALIVSPNDHGDNPRFFEGSRAVDQFGADFNLRWFEAVRGKGEFPVPQGKIFYYRMYEDRWDTAEAFRADKTVRVPLGTKRVTYTYDPADAPAFAGGLSANFGGAEYQEKPGMRDDIVTVWSAPFEADTFVRGKMSARLKVASDCEDTCFYLRISIETEAGDFPLRDDIRSLVFERGDYTPGEDVTLDFVFDEHAFLIRAGQRLRIDAASADRAHYVRHTNKKGLYCEQTETEIAHNTVDFSGSWLELPVE